MATCSSYEWSGWYPCSIEIDKLSRWRDFIRQTWIFFGVQKGEEKKRSLSLQTTSSPTWGLNCLRQLGIHGSDFHSRNAPEKKSYRPNKNPLELKGVTCAFSEPSFWVSMLVSRDGTSPSSIFIISLLLIECALISSHWPTTHAALNKFDPEPFHGSLGMEQLETSHRDLSIPHERLWTPQQRENTFRILEGHNLKMNWPQEHITRQETWV